MIAKISLFFLLVFAPWLPAKTMMWEVNGTGGGSVYLLGSIHVGNESMYPLDARINAAFERSNYLFLELKNNESTQASLNRAMFDQGRYESNDSIVNHIAPETYTRLQALLAGYEMPPQSMDRFKPWVVASNLTMLEAMKLGFSPLYGIDRHFEAKAERISKPIYALEGVHDQLHALSFDEGTYQEDFLNMVMGSKKMNSEETTQLLHAYMEGNETFFEAELLAPMSAYPLIKEKLLLERNAKMYESIKRYINNKKGRSYFIIVGLAHLLGEGGLLQRIGADGYAVTRVE